MRAFGAVYCTAVKEQASPVQPMLLQDKKTACCSAALTETAASSRGRVSQPHLAHKRPLAEVSSIQVGGACSRPHKRCYPG